VVILTGYYRDRRFLYDDEAILSAEGTIGKALSREEMNEMNGAGFLRKGMR
jgi:hypothetical protein